MFVDLTQTQEEFHYVDFSEKKKPEEDRIVTLYFLRNCTLHIAIFYRITFTIYISHAITLLCV